MDGSVRYHHFLIISIVIIIIIIHSYIHYHLFLSLQEPNANQMQDSFHRIPRQDIDGENNK